MTRNERVKKSKFLSLVLRHDPERVSLTLDAAGWVAVDVLLAAVNRHGLALKNEELLEIVRACEKQRFALSEDGQRIRANQGHSVEVDLQYPPQMPPAILYHGTATRFLQAIRSSGLRKMGRHDVHLSAETKVTLQVGGRHGEPVLLTIRSGEMHQAGFVFCRSANGVWLVDHVPAQYIDFPSIP